MAVTSNISIHDFGGTWRIDRTIHDAKSGSVGRFTGVAEFVADGDGMIYREDGQLMLGNGPAMKATRAYHWHQDGGQIVVHFEDGRDFHRFTPNAQSDRAEHFCDPDTYRVKYDFADWPEWRCEWRVHGPRKDYVMVSHYRREP